jgi:PIN domain nuclease of toxin-antitoxin system
MNGDDKLSRPAYEAIFDLKNEVFASVVNVWEAATKYRLGKFPEAMELVQDPRRVFLAMKFQYLFIDLEHARLGGTIVHPHRDPFDRMLAAQALLGNFRLVSNDDMFDSMLVPRLW